MEPKNAKRKAPEDPETLKLAEKLLREEGTHCDPDEVQKNTKKLAKLLDAKTTDADLLDYLLADIRDHADMLKSHNKDDKLTEFIWPLTNSLIAAYKTSPIAEEIVNNYVCNLELGNLDEIDTDDEL